MPRGEIHLPLAVDFADHPDVRKLTRFGRDARGCRDLFVQMMCYCKRNLSDGFVPAEQLGILVFPDPVKTGERDVAHLVEVELVQVVDGGYWLPSYLKRNKSRAEVEKLSEARAETGRVGGKRSGLVRGTQAKPNQFASAMSNTETESYTETNATAAAVGDLVSNNDLPSPILILAKKLASRTALAALRWDRMTQGQVELLTSLLDVHGVDTLVDTAIRTTNPDRAPTFGQAFIGTWAALPEPGRILGSVGPRCTEIGHEKLPADDCNMCRVDQRVALAQQLEHDVTEEASAS